MRNKIRIPDTASLLRGAGIIGMIFLVLPVLVVIPVSFVGDQYLRFPPSTWSLKWYENLFTAPQWYEPLLHSLTIAFLVACISVVLGLIGAYGLYHTRWKGKLLITLAFLLPLFVPPVVLGVGLLFMFAKIGLFDTIPGVVLSHVLLALPFTLLISSASLARSNMRLEEVACSLGAKRLYAFFRVTLPQIRTGLIAAGILSFIVSFDELVVVLFITSFNARTLPRQMFDGIRYDLDPTVAVVSSMLILISLGIVALSLRVKNKYSN